MAASGVAVLAALLWMLGRLVFRPLQMLTAHAQAVASNDDIDSRLRLRGFHEFDVLGREMDRMLDALAEARARLLDQSFRSGVAEMASGVLHNIGNSMVPLATKLVTAAEELAAAPHDDIRAALAELEAPNTSPGRRRDLEEFLCFAAGEFDEMIRRTQETVDAARAHANTVQQILNDQNAFSRASRVNEPLELEQLVREGLRLIPDEIMQGLSITVDAAVDVPRAFAPRVAVQQVLGNLLVNAAEAVAEQIARGGRGHLAVRIDAIERPNEERAFTRVRVVDDGVGLAPEQLARLFERGFSTKSRGSGLGLHWSFNTTTAVGGMLQASSPGPGKGAAFELLLPTAAVQGQTTVASAGVRA